MTAAHRSAVGRSARGRGVGNRRSAVDRPRKPVDAVARPLVDRPHDRLTALPRGAASPSFEPVVVTVVDPLEGLPGRRLCACGCREPAVVAVLDPLEVRSPEQSLTAAGPVGT